MAYKDYELDKNNSQNINDTTWQDTSSDQSTLLDTNTLEQKNKENIPHLTEEEQSSLDEKRNSSGFQQGLQDLLPNGEMAQKKKAPGSLNALIQEWQKDAPTVDNQLVNATKLPEQLKKGIKNLSSLSMDDVKVHYNSSEPAKIGRLAYTQGMNIYLAPGQEKLLAHQLATILQQKQAQEKPTDKENNIDNKENDTLQMEIDKIAKEAIGLSTNKTASTTLEKESNELKIETWTAKHGHKHLFEGINDDMNETAIIAALIENFYNRTDFDYNFSSLEAFSGKGDCSTLSKEFVTIARDVFGIKNMATESGNKGYFVQGGGKIIHKTPVTGNIDNGAHWFFESHTWALWNGKPIDVLFGQLGVKNHQTNIKGTAQEEGVEYTGGNLTFYLKEKQTNFDRYTSDPSLKMSSIKIAKGKKGTADPSSKFSKLF